MTDEQKTMAIGKVLGRFDAYYGEGTQDDNAILVDIDALAEEAIVIECEVRHTSGWDGYQGPWTKFTHIVRALCGRISIKGGHLGKPGKAIAIIIHEEASDEVLLPIVQKAC